MIAVYRVDFMTTPELDTNQQHYRDIAEKLENGLLSKEEADRAILSRINAATAAALAEMPKRQRAAARQAVFKSVGKDLMVRFAFIAATLMAIWLYDHFTK